MNSVDGHSWMRWLPTGLVVGLARIGPLGLWGRAPGTNGSAFGLLLYVAVFHPLGWPAQLLLGAVLAILAVGVCGEAEKRLHLRDPGEVILDEVVAQPLVFLGLPGMLGGAHWSGWVVLALGFGLFRLFDVWKPLGIARLQALPGGQGVVIDDLAAAAAACGVLNLLVWLAGTRGWIPLAL